MLVRTLYSDGFYIRSVCRNAKHNDGDNDDDDEYMTRMEGGESAAVEELGLASGSRGKLWLVAWEDGGFGRDLPAPSQMARGELSAGRWHSHGTASEQFNETSPVDF